MDISVTGQIPAGSIVVEDASDPSDIRLRLAPDHASTMRGG